ncbi:MAG: hypothetical protein H0Z38_09875 [Firmicutes bacterium]|nr:hypothetical protein [Bacillota bacterium]
MLALRDADALLVPWVPPLGRDLLRRLPNCRVIVRYGSGVENIDISAATECGISVLRNPGVHSEEVANHTMALCYTVCGN